MIKIETLSTIGDWLNDNGWYLHEHDGLTYMDDWNNKLFKFTKKQLTDLPSFFNAIRDHYMAVGKRDGKNKVRKQFKDFMKQED